MDKKYTVAIVIVVIIVVLGILYYYGSQQTSAPTIETSSTSQTAATTTPPAPALTLTAALSETNKSKESGAATISDENGMAKVTITLIGETGGAIEPAQLVAGSCAKPGAAKFALSAVASGTSETTLTVSTAQLLSELPLALNVQKSMRSKTGVACGDVMQSQ